MRGTNYLLAITTTTDEVTNEVKPVFAFPVQLCKGTDDDKVKFDIAAPSGAKREQIYRDTATGEIVTDDQCRRGVRLTETDFREVPQEAIDQIDAEAKITMMTALGTVPLAGLREQYGDRITGRYYVQTPKDGGSPKAYRLTYLALAGKGKDKPQAIIVKRTKSKAQALGFIYADTTQECLVMCEVAFAAAVRPADDQVKAPATVVVEQAQLDLAKKVIASLPDGTPALDTEIDEAQARKRELIEQAVAGEAIEVTVPVVATVANDDLEAQLMASLA